MPSVAPDPFDREVVDRPEARVGRVGAGDGRFVVRREADVRDRDDAHARIASRACRTNGAARRTRGRARRSPPRDLHAGFLLQLAARRAVEVVVGLDEPAGQRPVPPEGMALALHEQHRQPPGAHCQQHHVDGHRDRSVLRRIIRREELRL